jgi:hypothetical protein
MKVFHHICIDTYKNDTQKVVEMNDMNCSEYLILIKAIEVNYNNS